MIESSDKIEAGYVGEGGEVIEVNDELQLATGRGREVCDCIDPDGREVM